MAIEQPLEVQPTTDLTPPDDPLAVTTESSETPAPAGVSASGPVFLSDEEYMVSAGPALGKLLRTLKPTPPPVPAGESYQVCLTNRIRAPFTGDALALYGLLRRHNPAPFSAFMRTSDFSVLETSPERFLRIDPGGLVEARPIKGTIRRSPDPVEDRRLADELSRSDKNRAEHLMIVDVLRNDLGRVARYGSVRVPELMTIETRATVHHIVSSVRATLAEAHDAIDCIRAAFPGGSMTGAPKLRTMEIIDRLETSARGVYSGALGYFSIDGAVDLSMVIRTAVVADGSISLGVGGGVVATSDPDDEFDEAMLKGAALMQAIQEYQGTGAPRRDVAAVTR